MASSLIRLLLLVLVSLHVVSGLTCYSCTGTKLTTDISVVNTALKNLGFGEDAACDNGDKSVASTTCVPTSGLVEKCVTVKGTGSGELAGLSFTASGTYRECQNVLSTVADGCSSASDLGPFASIGLDSFQAEACYCSTDNCNGYMENGQTTLAPALIPCLASLLLAVFAVL